MKKNNLSKAYREMHAEHFPRFMEISLYDDAEKQTLYYEKVRWDINGDVKGLRYGENPGQEAAFYKLINGNLTLGDVSCISPGQYLVSDMELLQSGKHPGKTNITDIDNALNILRYLTEKPCAVIVKHNNPCGVAQADRLADAYSRAWMADRIAAFGGAIACNRPIDTETAELISGSYSEVVAAPEFEQGAVGILEKRKNLRIMKIENIKRLTEYAGARFLDAKSLIDGGLIFQWSYVPEIRTKNDLLPARAEWEGKTYTVDRQPTEQEYNDLLFGWLIEAGVTSNSVLYVKNGVTVGIGTGEQDRVGVAEIARDKAYKKTADRLSWEYFHCPYSKIQDKIQKARVDKENADLHGGLLNAVMVSDAFFPFRDGIEIGLVEGVSAVIQPGGSLRDFESIQACNEYNAAMVFTGQRSFKH